MICSDWQVGFISTEFPANEGIFMYCKILAAGLINAPFK